MNCFYKITMKIRQFQLSDDIFSIIYDFHMQRQSGVVPKR